MSNIDKKKVVIIDYKLGNLFSVQQACEAVGINAKISSNKEDIINADALILPGVGAFLIAMTNLKELGLAEVIIEKVNNNTPLFGICLGLQLLFSESEEFGAGKGLDLIAGVIKKLPYSLENRKIKVPHISWNTIYKFEQDWSKTPLRDLKNDDFMYFIHSYYVKPSDNACILTKENEEGIITSLNHKKHDITAVQFHPEKSADKGISIYKNWALINNLL